MPEMHTLRSTDGTALRVARWGSADRDVLIVHGLAEHAGRYEHVAAALVAAGWRVTLLELRGHGRSEGRRGHVMSWQDYADDVRAAATFVGRPFVLLAHSMGGLVSLSTLLEPMSPAVRALALSNPLLGVKVQAPAIKIKAAKLLSRLLPWLPLSNELDTNAISRDPAVVRAYEADPLVYGKITPRWYTEMLAAQVRVHAAAASYRLPLHLMVSDADQMCDHEAALRLFAAYGGPKSHVLYPHLYHELFNEPEQKQVLAELIAWLETV